MNDKGHARWAVELMQPTHDLVGVSMGRKHVEIGDLGAHLNIFTEDFDRIGAGDKAGAARACRLIAREQDEITRIRRIVA